MCEQAFTRNASQGVGHCRESPYTAPCLGAPPYGAPLCGEPPSMEPLYGFPSYGAPPHVRWTHTCENITSPHPSEYGQ